MKSNSIVILSVGSFIGLMALGCNLIGAAGANQPLNLAQVNHGSVIVRRSEPVSLRSMLRTRMLQMVLDRACAASDDIIFEMIDCVISNDVVIKSIRIDVANKCYKDAFGRDFDPDIPKQKAIICKEREKFEGLAKCIRQKTIERLSPKERDKLRQSLLDVGLCVMNSLDKVKNSTS